MDRKKDSKRTNERFIPSRIFHSSFFYHFLSVSYQFDIRFLSFCNPSFSYILSRFSALMSIPTRKKIRKQNSTEGLAPKKKLKKCKYGTIFLFRECIEEQHHSHKGSSLLQALSSTQPHAQYW